MTSRKTSDQVSVESPPKVSHPNVLMYSVIRAQRPGLTGEHAVISVPWQTVERFFCQNVHLEVRPDVAAAAAFEESLLVAYCLALHHSERRTSTCR